MFIKSKLSRGITLSLLSVSAYSTAFELEEVVVTATKRAQSVQDVPYNISAFSGENMERTGISDMAQLSRNIPGVAFMDKGPRSAGAFANSIAMRGINIEGSGNSADRPSSTAPTVGTYVGNTPLFTGLRLKDIERVEVLRGPQGTLYGSGAMGGIVRLIQNKPNLDETEVTLSTRLSVTDESGSLNNEADVIFNLPLSNSVAIRGNIGRVDNAGFIDTPDLYQLDANGSPVLADPSNPVTSPAATISKKDVNDEEIVNGRLAVLWDVSEDTSATLTYHAQRDEVAGGQADTKAFGDYKSGVKSEQPFERDVDLLSLDIESDLGFATMTVALSKTEIEGALTSDVTGFYSPEGALGETLNFPGYFGSGIDLYTEYYGNNPRFLWSSERSWEEEDTSLEIRLTSNTDGKYDWLAGFNYFTQDVDFRQNDFALGRNDYVNAVNNAGVTLIGLDGTPAVGPGFFTGRTANDLGYFFDNKTEFTDISIFGEFTYHVSEAWQITAGARYFDQEFDATQVGGLVVGDFVDGAEATFSEQDILFKLNTSYDLNSDTMLFFTWAEGFRRGGVNAVPADLVRPEKGETLTYTPDELTNTEIGIKGTWDSTWDYTATIFNVDWKSAQLNSSVTALALIGVSNIPEVRSRGVEFELTGNLTDSLLLSFGYAYVDTEVIESIADADSLAVVGSQLPVPEQTASLGLTYFQELEGDSELVWSLNASYRSETPSSTQAITGTNRLNYTVFSGFTLVDASAVYTQGPWSVTGFVNNLTNQRGTLGGLTVAEAGPEGQLESVVRPRTIGVGLRYTFLD